MPLDLISVNPDSFAYRDLAGQDKWTAWTPTRTGWTDVGTPTVVASYRVVGAQCFIQMKVTPATTVATTAGTSYITLPIRAKGYAGLGTMADSATNVVVGMCMVDVTNSRMYLPTQLATSDPLVIAGYYQV